MKLSLLINAKLLKVTGENDSPTLNFDRGDLHILNPFTVGCDSGEQIHFSEIIGCCVSDSFASETELVIVFEGRIYLRISLRDEDFIGFEAAVYCAKSGETTVFN